MTKILIDLFLLAGCFFSLAGTVGMLRMPDAFCRMQSSTNIATLGMLGIGIACLIYSLAVEHNPGMAVKIGLVVVFIFVTNPVASHALARAARKMGLPGVAADDAAQDDGGKEMQHD